MKIITRYLLSFVALNLMILVVLSHSLASGISNSGASNFVERPDFNRIFAQYGLSGTFVLYSLLKDQLTVVNAKRAATRFIPASTFKIVNSLIALESKVVSNENEIIPYGGKPQPFRSWEKDMSMRDAIKISNVPVYQEIARRVGIKQYTDWLKVLDYGNHHVGEDVETFWLQGPLKISAVEQVLFLARLAQKKLPVKPVIQSTVIRILKLRSKRAKLLYGKTGWTNTPNPDIGWFVGWVTSGQHVHTFALNIDIHSRQDSKYRKKVVMEFLKLLGIF